MKLIRTFTIVLALVVPAIAMATPSVDVTCCHGGACCDPGCPFCHHPAQ